MFPQIFGKYVLEREIAAGGMARVYLATLRGAGGFEKRLVVKQIRPELASDEAFVRRFVEEAKTAVELSHPNIVPVYELGVEQGVYFIAMELCEGVSLAEILSVTGPLSPEEGAYVGIEICRALDYAHRRAGIVHRDVTPRNVMIDSEGAVRLIDFGIAAPVAVEGESDQRVEIFGSPGHMAPEQMEGNALTPATDVFAVGVLLIEAWTGKPPYRRATAAECKRALNEQAQLPRVGVDELDQLVARATKLDPAERQTSPEELARPLRRFARTFDLGDLARRMGERVRETERRRDSAEAWLPGDGVSAAADTPATPPIAASETKTFATRGEPSLWATTPATRKLPDPDEEERPSEPDVGSITTSSARREPGGWRLAIFGAIGAGLAALVGARMLRPDPGPRPPARSPATASAPPVPSAEPAESASEAPSSAPPAPSAARVPVKQPERAPSASAPPVRASCQLRVSTLPPGAAVSIDGRGHGATPQSVELPCGPHTVTLTHSALGGQKTVPVKLAPEHTTSVSVDWSTATPRVVIQ